MKHSYALNTFTFYDRSGISEYLEKKAEDGWMLEKTGSVFWRFSKIEPKHISFAVTYFPSASAFDPTPSENQLRFRDFCEHTGWCHLADCAQMQIYYNENENPIPIETDALIETENIHKSAKKAYLPGYWMILGIGILMLIIGVYSVFDDPVETLSSTSDLCLSLLGLCEAVMGAGELILYYKWYKKAKKSAEESGVFVPTKDCRWMRWMLCFVMLIVLTVMFSSMLTGRDYSFRVGRLLLILIVSMFLVFAGGYAATGIMKKLGVSAKVNRRVTVIVFILLCNITIVGNTSFIIKDINHGNYLRRAVETYEYRGSTFNIYHDELPLYIEDLIDTDYDGYSTKAEVSSTPFVSRAEYFQRPRLDSRDQPSLEYTIVDVKLPLLFDICLDDMLNESGVDIYEEYGGVYIVEYAEIDPAEWKADRAYQLKSFTNNTFLHTYLIVYENRIIKFKPDFHPDSTQKAAAAEAFGK